MRMIKTSNQRSSHFLASPAAMRPHAYPQPLAYTTGANPGNPNEAHFCFAQLPANRPVVSYKKKGV